MKRDLPVLAITMNRVMRDADSFHMRELARNLAEMKEQEYPQAKPSRRERRAGKKESFEARLRKRFKAA